MLYIVCQSSFVVVVEVGLEEVLDVCRVHRVDEAVGEGEDAQVHFKGPKSTGILGNPVVVAFQCGDCLKHGAKQGPVFWPLEGSVDRPLPVSQGNDQPDEGGKEEEKHGGAEIVQAR